MFTIHFETPFALRSSANGWEDRRFSLRCDNQPILIWNLYLAEYNRRIENKRMGKEVRYTVTSDTVGLAIDSMSETANDVQEALSKARLMYEEGLANVSIKDDAGHQIDGDALLECITGAKSITEDLQAK
jgi:hypothetical protein